MIQSLAKKYYSRNDIQKALLSFAKDREIAPRYDGFFGKRPDVIEYISDIRSLANKGVISLHMSEERWENPLLLGNQNLSDEEKDKNKSGWDLILDLDGVDFKYAKIIGKIIIEYLQNEMDIKNISLKFSGNKGFHIGIPFEAFSSQCPGLVPGITQTRLLFPDVAKKTALFLLHKLKKQISDAIIKSEKLPHLKALQEISRRYNIDFEDLEYNSENKTFNFLKIIEIDTILITSRHLFRMPYSLHEKSNLVSIPIEPQRIMEFQKEEAKPQNVDPQKYKEFEFLKYNPKHGKDANKLLENVYSDEEYIYDQIFEEIQTQNKKSQNAPLEINEEINIKDFPNTISYILKNNFPDGKKRALFVLLTYLYSINWTKENIKELVYDWNTQQSPKLKKNYINTQIFWFESQDKKISTPNFDNDNYYKSIGIPKQIIQKDQQKFKINAKNPLHYTYLQTQEKNNK